jgi:modulator of FtsH protease HflK
MADQNDPKLPADDDRPEDHLSGDVPVEEDPVEETEQPRRAASAEFVVDAEVGSEAALRAAMDPATQSLADALRLSFRLLQLVIFVLVILFFASGLQTVDEGESGVMVRWGKIVPVAGQESLEPGLHFSAWPYPIGEFIIFDADNLAVNVGNRYWPSIRPGETFEAAAAGASPSRIVPDEEGRHGYVLTGDGDMGHIQVAAQYRIEQPSQFVQSLRVADANKLVQRALDRATVHAAARLTLQELADRTDELRYEVQRRAQEVLDDLQSGIQLTSVTIPDSTVPLAVRRTFHDLQNARHEADRRIEEARLRANQHLIDAAGERYRQAIRAIDQYETAVDGGNDVQAEEHLRELFAMIDRGELSGEVARIVQHARAYRSQIESSLGNEARRFASLLPAFREHPEFIARERWLDVYANVLERRDTELIFVPHQVGHVKLHVSGLHEVKERRQQSRLDRREQEAYSEFYGRQRGGQYIPFVDDIRESGPGRQLRIDPEEGRARGLGGRR